MDLPDPLTRLPDMAAIADPVERAKQLGEAQKAVTDLQRAIMTARAAAVTEVKTGRTWDQVGELLDLHPSRASQIARGVSGGGKRKPHPA